MGAGCYESNLHTCSLGLTMVAHIMLIVGSLALLYLNKNTTFMVD